MFCTHCCILQTEMKICDKFNKKINCTNGFVLLVLFVDLKILLLSVIFGWIFDGCSISQIELKFSLKIIEWILYNLSWNVHWQISIEIQRHLHCGIKAEWNLRNRRMWKQICQYESKDAYRKSRFFFYFLKSSIRSRH